MFRFVFCCVLAALLCSCSDQSGSSGPDPVAADLVVYSSHPDDLLSFLVKEFRERTGLRVATVSAGTGALLNRLEEEAASPAADVMLGGGVESLEASHELFAAYRSSENEAVPAQFRAADDRWTGFSVLSVVIVYNRRLVAEASAPRGWADLTTPRFFGAIAFADPRTSGSAYSQLRAFFVVAGGGSVLADRFTANLGNRPFLESTKVGSTVSSGEALVGLTFDTYAPWPDLAVVYPEEGTLVLPDGLAVVKGGPHPAAARRFVDFLLGRDVASVLVARFHRRSVRTDAGDPEGLPSLRRLRPLVYDVQAAAREKAATLEHFTSLLSVHP